MTRSYASDKGVNNEKGHWDVISSETVSSQTLKENSLKFMVQAGRADTEEDHV
jgi:major membrane immunogen (membrane-anchored lipoprotein)